MSGWSKTNATSLRIWTPKASTKPLSNGRQLSALAISRLNSTESTLKLVPKTLSNNLWHGCRQTALTTRPSVAALLAPPKKSSKKLLWHSALNKWRRLVATGSTGRKYSQKLLERPLSNGSTDGLQKTAPTSNLARRQTARTKAMTRTGRRMPSSTLMATGWVKNGTSLPITRT